jgi:hypothetical protein
VGSWWVCLGVTCFEEVCGWLCGKGLGVFMYVGGTVYWVVVIGVFSIINSSIGLHLLAKVSFICFLCLLRSYIYIWYRSNVLSDWPFFSVWSISSVSLIVPYVCPVSGICSAYFEFCLFVFMAWICSSYRILNVRPVCPI